MRKVTSVASTKDILVGSILRPLTMSSRTPTKEDSDLPLSHIFVLWWTQLLLVQSYIRTEPESIILFPMNMDSGGPVWITLAVNLSVANAFGASFELYLQMVLTAHGVLRRPSYGGEVECMTATWRLT